VLVAACPCAGGLATPLSVVAAVGAGARRGLLIKGGLVLEQLAKVDTLVVDKTGTLTTGRAQVTELVRFDELWSEDDLLAWAAALEHTASHPLASAILQAAAERGVPVPEIDQVEVRPSRGIMGQAHGETWLLGAWRLLEEEGSNFPRGSSAN
jgi:P-type E1-E2 ATPase